ncbi:MAG: hypothetical protein RIC35_12385 [Marinoscillum sp.]
MKIIFPRPFAIAIDDLGWIKGQNEGEDGYGPYRTGIPRNMTLADYKAVVDLAKKVGVRLQGLFIMGEMDRENFLGNHPTTTYQRGNYDNTENISDLQIEMMDYVKSVSTHLEFGLHGVGHEFWPEDGIRRRAEWYNTEDDHPWPEEDIRDHLDCFVQIMAQYGITQENGHSFPKSFVPCAYSYYWNPNGDYSLGKILGQYGVKYANTDFRMIPECSPPAGDNSAGFDHKVHVMNRYNYGNLWSAIGKLPDVPLEDQTTDFIETHWPNLIGMEESDHASVTEMWIEYYRKVQASPDRFCAKNTSQIHSQWLYKKHIIIEELEEGKISIDNSNMPSEVYQGFFPSNMVLKLKLNEGEHVSKATINGCPIPGYLESEGYALLYLPQLINKKYVFEYELGRSIPNNIIWHDTTSNLFDIRVGDHEIQLNICAYGEQEYTFLTERKIKDVISNNPGIEIKNWYQTEGKLVFLASAHDIQGEIGSIEIKF